MDEMRVQRHIMKGGQGSCKEPTKLVLCFFFCVPLARNIRAPWGGGGRRRESRRRPTGACPRPSSCAGWVTVENGRAVVGSDDPLALAVQAGDPSTTKTGNAGANEPKRRQRPRGDSPEDAEDARLSQRGWGKCGRALALAAFSARPDGRCGCWSNNLLVAQQQARHGRIQSARPHPLRGSRSGLGAIATADVKARWRQPKKTPAKGGHRSPEARQPLGGRERSKRGRSWRGKGAPRDHEHGELGPRASQRDSRCAPAKGAVQAATELT